MIVQMKKLDVLLYHRQKEAFLQALRKLGIVHVQEKQEASSQDLLQASADFKECESVTISMKNRMRTRKIKKLPSQKSDLSPDEIMESFNDLDKSRQVLDQKIIALNKEIEALEAWGDFKPELLEKIRQAGVRTRFFEISSKKYDALLEKHPDLIRVSSEGSKVLAVLFEKGDAQVIDADEISLPNISLSGALKKKRKYLEELNKTEEDLDGLLRYLTILEKEELKRKSKMAFESARVSFDEEGEGKLLHLTGWMPKKLMSRTVQIMDEFNAWYTVEDPAQEDDVPVKLKNGPFARLFEGITKIYSLPDYFELDPTPFFAPFFMFFVGLCLGDVGYGALVFLGGLGVLFAGGKKVRSLAVLVTILGASVIMSGIMLNSCFGQPLVGGPEVADGFAFFKTGPASIRFLAARQTERGAFFPAMSFALLLGFMQVMFGIFLNMVNRIRNKGILFGIQPFSSLMMIIGFMVIATHTNAFDLNIAKFQVGSINLGSYLLYIPEKVASVLFFAGLTLFLLFNNPYRPLFKKTWFALIGDLVLLAGLGGMIARSGMIGSVESGAIALLGAVPGWIFGAGAFIFLIANGLGGGLMEIYFFLTGFVGNILSYLRLFALGLAGGMLGNAFNTIASDITFIPAAILLLLVGHGLNFFLSALGAFIHSLRLTFVEFYPNLGFQGGGKKYSPLHQMES